ncbi:hypothetical protein HanIR_Chr05g0255631 [Helianthus annuus]|nr:hypothetical protein HanIR_Chr05g0255631 [Helianthus annuus]
MSFNMLHICLRKFSISHSLCFFFFFGLAFKQYNIWSVTNHLNLAYRLGRPHKNNRIT